VSAFITDVCRNSVPITIGGAGMATGSGR
jgi:hypothetical protein